MSAYQRPEPGVIHLLGLPRDLVAKLFDAFEQSYREPDAEGSEELQRIFGAPPYTYFEDIVPSLREFGRRDTGLSHRITAWRALRNELQDMVIAEQKNYKMEFGFYKDKAGHLYKFEKDDQVSVKYRQSEARAFDRGSTVLVEHIDNPEYTVSFSVDDDMLTGKSRTVLMKYTLIEVRADAKKTTRYVRK